MKLNKKQTLALDYLEDDITTELLYGGGAGGGKSILGCYWLAKMCMKYPGTRWVMGRNEMTTLKETTLVSFFKVAKMQGLKRGVHYKYIDNPKNIIVFNNGSEILLKDLKFKPSDENFDDLGSLEITGAFVDEGNQITEKAKNVLFSRIRHALDENGLIPKMLITCNPAKSWVYKVFYKPWKENALPAFRKFIQALVTDNTDISKHYRENLLKLDKVSKERLLFGNWEFDDDPATLMDYERILECFTNTKYAVAGQNIYKLTCDVARFGKDKTVIGLWYSPNHVKLLAYRGISTTQISSIIEGYKLSSNLHIKRIVVDEDGVGGGVVDQTKCTGFVNNSRPLPAPINPKTDPRTGKKLPENYDNLKSQCYFHLANRVNNGELYIECEESMQEFIIEEFEQVKRYEVDKDGKLKVVPKEKVKEILGRSPDFSDCIMMGELVELSPKFKVVSLYD